MNNLVSQLRQKKAWQFSVQLIGLYCASVLIYAGAHRIWSKAATPLKAKGAVGSVALAVLAAALSFGAAFAMKHLAALVHVDSRKAMVLLGAALSMEKHWRSGRLADAGVELGATLGVAAGAAAGLYWLMPLAPWIRP